MTPSTAVRALTFALVIAIARVASAGIALTDPVYGPTYGSYSAPVATNGSAFLALWNVTSPQQVRGALADANGRVLTPVSFLVVPDAWVTSVASAADNFVVAWIGLPSGSHLSLLDPNGRFVRDIATLPYVQGLSKIAVSGDRILAIATLESSSNPPRNVATVVALDGTIVRSEFVIADPAAAVDAIATPDGFAIAIGGSQSVTLMRLSRDGAVVEETSVPVASRLLYAPVSIASSGGEVLLAWAEPVSSPAFGDRIGWTIVPGGNVHRFAPSTATSVYVLSTFWTGTSYSVIAAAVPPVTFDVNRAGESTTPRPLPFGVDGFSGANIGPLLFFTAFRTGRSMAATFALDGGTAERQSTPISVTADSQMPPDLASDGSTFAASWTATSGPELNLRAARFTAASERLDPKGIGVASLNSMYGDAATKIAGGDSMYLVGWYDAGLRMRRIESSGTVLDPAPLTIPDATSFPYDIVWNGEKFLVVWTQAGRIAGAFVHPDGSIERTRYLSPPPAGTEYATAPVAAWDGRRFLVAWTTLRYSPICGECRPEYVDIRAIRVSATGDMIDATAAVVTASAAYARLASSGSDFLVVSDSIEPPYLTNAYLISGDTGALYVPKPVTVAQWSSQLHSDVTWNGRDYVVALQYTLGGAFPTMFDPAWLATIRVSRSGVARDLRVRSSGLYPGLGVAADAAGHIAVAVTEASQELGAWRVRAYFDSDFEPAPPPPSDPANVTTSVDGDALVVSWTPTSTNHAGFVVDVCLEPPPSFCIAATAPADATSIRLSGYSRAPWVHVSAANAGGTASAPLIPQVPPRRRAAGR